jgi:hypothetical protein
MNDPNVDEVRRVRDELVKKYGGLDGWIKHLQSLKRTRERNSKTRTTNAASLARSRKNSTHKSATGPVVPPTP